MNKIKEPIGVIYTDKQSQTLADVGDEVSESSGDGAGSEEGTGFLLLTEILWIQFHSWLDFLIKLSALTSGLQLGESREHASARVLSTTSDETRSKTEGLIREVTEEAREGNQVNPDLETEGESKDEAVDSESTESQQKVEAVPVQTVFNRLSYTRSRFLSFSFGRCSCQA